ncbi:uncharacterized protein LOC110021595 [Phalaenopsis equestris]|uniref:uncharacterized protein LOC110021595 n=1 Tax=Phalaenopsis equestris TaxID=78828 RepID=UPI0009E30D5C|nr:uncharacterized protein LOC110021595 [Phalaenopsis equestris]
MSTIERTKSTSAGSSNSAVEMNSQATPQPIEKKLAFYSRELKAKHMEIGRIIYKFKKLNNSSNIALLSLKQEYIKRNEELFSILSLFVSTNKKLIDAREELEHTRASLDQFKEILQAYENKVFTLEEENRRLRSLRRRTNLGTK